MGTLLDTVVKINISLTSKAVPQASFSIPLIVGPTAATFSGAAKAYVDPSEMLADGYTTSSIEYKYALELMEQAVTPTEFIVGKRIAAVKQQDTFAVNTVTATHQYKFDLNGQVISYTAGGGDAQQDILAGLLADIGTVFPTNPPVTGVVTGTGSGALLTLTSSVFGQGVDYSLIDTLLTHVNTVPNHGIQDDIGAIELVHNEWYGLILCSNADYDILQAAALIEEQLKIFIAVSNDAAIPTNVSTDVLSVLKALNYTRTALVYSPGSYNKGIEAAWMGGQLPAIPGSNNWAFKQLTGISPDVKPALSDSDILTIVGNAVGQVPGKNGNVYTELGGVANTMFGIMVGGQFIDITIGVDWLETTIQTNIFAALQAAAKIPYTDKGTDVLIQAVLSAIQQGIVNGLIDGNSPYSVTAPKVLSVSANQRANRVAPTISFSCRLQGAFNAVDVEGNVTV